MNEVARTESVETQISEFNALTPAERSEKIEQMKSGLFKAVAAFPHAEYPDTAKHHFSGDLYAREYFLAKGALCLGRVHKFDHIAIVAKGDVSIISEDGWVRLQAGAILQSKAGAQRLVFGHEDTIFVTIHGAKEDADSLALDDPKKMKDALTFENKKTFLEWLAHKEASL